MSKIIIYKKTELLKAMKRVLKEYKNNIHIASVAICPLCLLYNKDDDKRHIGHECRLCPMHVFHKSYEHGGDFYSCITRKCKPVNCEEDYTKDTNELKAVIDLYEEAINTVEGMTASQLNEPKAFMFLIKIDKLVAKKYCLV
ncbi:MAG: hypothetical protein WC428_02190 [Candidatus Paceibacterota bacterium]|jgi:hypothetical protein